MGFSTGELNGLKATNELHMWHLCKILDRDISGQDAHGQQTVEWVSRGQFPMGLKMTPGREVQVGRETVIIDALARLPMAARPHISQDNRLEVVKWFGQTVTVPELWDVVGLPAVGPSGFVVQVIRVIL